MKTTNYYKYARDVVDGNIVAGNYTKLACKRFLDDLERDDLVFKPGKVRKVVKFTKIFKHSLGKFAGKPFELLPWQEFVVANIYGFYNLDGTRRYTQAYLEISRKNGKSSLAAILGLYALTEERQAQVICAANSRDQAKILLDCAQSYVRSIDKKQKYYKMFRSEIKFPMTDSLLKIVSADTNKLDGLNCSTFVIDEAHAAKDGRMFDVLRSSQGMRENPLAICITTAGFNLNGWCYKKRSGCAEVLEGIKKDDTLFAMIFTIDEEDDWQNEEVWQKASPNLGTTVSYKYMRDQVNSAINNPSEEVGVRTKLLNQWMSSSDVWIPETYINKASTIVDLNDFKGELCYVGVDLAAVGDLTAVSYMIPKDGRYYFKTQYYLPEAGLNEKFDKEMYKQWRREGLLTITPGNTTDYDYITKDLLAANEIVELATICYDKWNCTQWAIQATELGLPLEEYPQSIGYFNRPTKEMERALLKGIATIDNNEITRYCFRNVVLRYDHCSNCKPDKNDRYVKIDGVIAMCEALGGYLNSPRYSGEIFVI